MDEALTRLTMTEKAILCPELDIGDATIVILRTGPTFTARSICVGGTEEDNFTLRTTKSKPAFYNALLSKTWN
ncbi:hypothetical protein J1614_010734 [Plenodomus biglobosus]|nr:hypothetical protein J1614_010734 [Plenodomus biglobosus]